MSSLVMAITMSLDGYAAGPDISMENAMGVGGEALHEWLFDGDRDRHSAPARASPPVSEPASWGV